VLLAPWVAIVIRYLTFHFDTLTQSFYRFLIGAAGLLVLAAIGIAIVARLIGAS